MARKLKKTKSRKRQKKTFLIKGNNIICKKTGRKVGKIMPNGICVGPHPWTEEEVLCSSPEELIKAQEKLAKTETEYSCW